MEWSVFSKYPEVGLIFLTVNLSFIEKSQKAQSNITVVKLQSSQFYSLYVERPDSSVGSAFGY